MDFKIKGKVFIDEKGEKLLKEKSSGIVYNSHLKSVEGFVKVGDLVEIYNSNRELIGTGFYEPINNIAVRVMTFDDETFNKDYLEFRLKKAKKIREKLGFKNFYRWINAIADGLSGLIIDKYNDLAVIQSSSVGIDKIQKLLAKLILEIDPDIRGVYARNDFKNRKIFGLKIWKGFLTPTEDKNTTTIINEGDISFLVDVKNGNKTGFYIDQRLNRLESINYAINCEKVLDCFSYTGGFGLHAMKIGAHVTFIEHNEIHAELLRKNIELNEIKSDYELFITDYWEFMENNRNVYDMIILDPPNYINSRNEIKIGEQKYYEINLLALRKLRRNGIFISSSCSYFIDTIRFQSLILKAANELGIKLMRIGRVRGASPCHLIDPKASGLEYLKCYFFIRTE